MVSMTSINITNERERFQQRVNSNQLVDKYKDELASCHPPRPPSGCLILMAPKQNPTTHLNPRDQHGRQGSLLWFDVQERFNEI